MRGLRPVLRRRAVVCGGGSADKLVLSEDLRRPRPARHWPDGRANPCGALPRRSGRSSATIDRAGCRAGTRSDQNHWASRPSCGPGRGGNRPESLRSRTSCMRFALPARVALARLARIRGHRQGEDDGGNEQGLWHDRASGYPSDTRHMKPRPAKCKRRERLKPCLRACP